MNEQKMREIMTARLEENFNAKLSTNIFSNKLISEGVFAVAQHLTEELEKPANRQNAAIKTLRNLVPNLIGGEKEVISFSLSLIEIVLGGLTLYSIGSIRNSIVNRVVTKLMKGDKTNVNHLQSGFSLFEMVVEVLPYINWHRETKNQKTELIYTIDPDVTTELADIFSLIVNGSFYPMPMTTPPLDWELYGDKMIGGYVENRSSLIRSQKINLPSNRIDESALYGTPALKALNLIQSVPYRINKVNLKRMQENLKEPVKPEKPEGFSEWVTDITRYKENNKLYREDKENNEKPEMVDYDQVDVDIYKNHIALIKKYKSDYGKYQTNLMAIQIAEMYKDEEAIYFPHNFDYRGRMYPIPVGLSPQGNDIQKGLLEFSESVELTQAGVTQLIAYLASVYGHDKENWETKYELGVKLLESSNDETYLEAEEPFIFAQVRDKLLEVKQGNMVSHIIMAIDGSCNGLQHMSALTLDKKGGKLVNVSDEKNRYDIYQIIADEASKLIEEEYMKAKIDISESDVPFTEEQIEVADPKDAKKMVEYNKKLREFELYPTVIGIMKGYKSRKIAKRPVMINPYGGSYSGYNHYVRESLEEFYPLVANSVSSNMITRSINNAMKMNLSGGDLYKKWIGKVFGEIAVENNKNHDLYYFTPDGFRVINYLNKTETKEYKFTSLVGMRKRKKIKLQKIVDELDVRKIQTAIKPNFIHSLDATHLRMTALEMEKNNNTQLSFIHDSFATNPNDISLLGRITREQFIKLYDENNHPADLLMQSIENQCFVSTYENLPNIPQFNGSAKMDIKSVINNEFFFA